MGWPDAIFQINSDFTVPALMNSPSGFGFKLDVKVEFVGSVPAEIDIVEWNQHLFIEGWQNSHFFVLLLLSLYMSYNFPTSVFLFLEFCSFNF